MSVAAVRVPIFHQWTGLRRATCSAPRVPHLNRNASYPLALALTKHWLRKGGPRDGCAGSAGARHAPGELPARPPPQRPDPAHHATHPDGPVGHPESFREPNESTLSPRPRRPLAIQAAMEAATVSTIRSVKQGHGPSILPPVESTLGNSPAQCRRHRRLGRASIREAFS